MHLEVDHLGQEAVLLEQGEARDILDQCEYVYVCEHGAREVGTWTCH